jgi:hypothetical protein
MIARGALVALLLLGAAGCASATPPPAPPPPNPNLTCTLQHRGSRVDSLKALPAPVRAALKQLTGAMADRGEFFNAGDFVTKPGPFKRFIRGGFGGGHWFVWYEQGGIAYWHQVVVFGGDLKAPPLFNGRSTMADLCAMTDSVLDGAAP